MLIASFVVCSPFLRIYIEYCNNFERSLSRLRDLEKVLWLHFFDKFDVCFLMSCFGFGFGFD
jgi:hypothetical protein